MNHEQIIENDMLLAQNAIDMNKNKFYNIYKNNEIFICHIDFEDANDLLSWFTRLYKNDVFTIVEENK
jgi:hypothetical protein